MLYDILYTVLLTGHLNLYSPNLPELLLCYLLRPELLVALWVINHLVTCPNCITLYCSFAKSTVIIVYYKPNNE